MATNTPDNPYSEPSPQQRSLIGKLLRWCLTNKLIMGMLVLLA
ncbi:unnamed protein product, partial [marine sediment metagenome]